MSNPTVTAVLDKPSYAKDDQITLTVNYSDPDQEQLRIEVRVTDASGNTTGPIEVSALIDPLTVSVVDASGRTWTKVSDSGAVAVFTTTA